MSHLKRTFTVAELEEIGVPFWGPSTLDTVSDEDARVLDEVMEVDDHGTALHRRIFRHDGTCWEIYYRHHGEHGLTWDDDDEIEATAVEERQVTVTRWEPIETTAEVASDA